LHNFLPFTPLFVLDHSLLIPPSAQTDLVMGKKKGSKNRRIDQSELDSGTLCDSAV
jgi:hypothetical protein